MSRDFGVSIICTENPNDFLVKTGSFREPYYLPGPLGPWVISSAFCRGFGKQFEIRDAACTVSHGRPNAIITSITTANDDHVLASGIDEVTVLKLGIHQRRCVQLEIFHCEVNTTGTSVRDLEVSWPGRSCGQHHCVVLCSDRLHIDIHTDVGIGNIGLFSVSIMNWKVTT